MPRAKSGSVAAPAKYSPETLKQAERMFAAHMDLCRKDVNAFTEYVLRDEVTGQRVKQAPLHLRINHLARRHKRLGLLAMPGCGKSQAMIARILWCLGNNPKGRYAIIAQSQTKAKGMLQTIARYIESSADLHNVFPDLRPGDQWTDSAITVQREGYIKDSSVVAFGVTGDITGSRVDGMVIDDILSEKNTRTPAMRQKMYEFAFRTLFDRLEKPHGWIIFLGNAWHPDDLMHRLERGTHNTDAKRDESEMAWHVERIRVIDEEGNPTWPERFPAHIIEGMREEFGPLEFARKYLCEARSDEDAKFKRCYIEAACEAGKQLRVIDHLEHLVLPREWGIDPFELQEGIAMRMEMGVWDLPLVVVFGVDLGVAQNAAADETVLVGLVANKINHQRLIIHVRGGRWDFHTISQRILSAYDSFRPDLVMIESVAAQRYLVEHLQRQPSDIKLRPFYTGSNKWDPILGVQALSGSLAMGRYIIPVPDGTLQGASYDADVAKLLEEKLFFTPTKHTGDRLMAEWFADRAAHTVMSGGGGVKVISLSPERAALDKAASLAVAAGRAPIDWAAEERYENERRAAARTYTRLNSRGL
jgi:hypothetical protein